MEHELEKTIAKFAQSQSLFAGRQNALLAISGGADSMAMLYALAALRASGLIKAKLVVGHVNHGLRGKYADEDERFVADRAGELRLEFHHRAVDVREYAQRERLSIETAARNLRREALAEMAAEAGCDCIATAHHSDDNAETLVHRLQRGTGLRGLAGIWPKRQIEGIGYIRPLLCVRRWQIVKYLQQRGIGWREDASNACMEHTRNVIRRKLLPWMELEAAGSLVQDMGELSAACRRYQKTVLEEVQELWKDIVVTAGPEGVELKRRPFNTAAPAVRLELLSRCIEHCGGGLRSVTSAHYSAMMRLADSGKSGKQIALPGGLDFRCYYERISIAKADRREHQEMRGKFREPEEMPLDVPGTAHFGGRRFTTRIFDASGVDLEDFIKRKTAAVEWFDADAIAGKLRVRRRRQGDRFTPLGGDEQKVGKFLTAAKIPPHKRQRTAIVADEEKILWLVPFRAGNEAKIGPQTRRILEITIDLGEQRP